MLSKNRIKPFVKLRMNAHNGHVKPAWLFVILITIVIVVIYSNTLNNEFQFDDTFNIVENKAIHIDSISLSSLKDATFNKTAYRRPVTNITFALNYYFGELDVFGYHLVNILIHIITAIAIYLFLYDTMKGRVQGSGVRGQGSGNKRVFLSPLPLTLTLSPEGRGKGEGERVRVRGNFQIPEFRDKPFWIAMIATLLWATSPVQTQAVTYIVQRATSMATMFYMLSLLCYVKGRGSAGVRGQGSGVRSKGRLDGLLASGFWLLTPGFWLLASLFFAFLSFGTKEIAATLPLVIILYEIYFFARFDPRSVKKISLYLGIMAVLFTIVGLLYISADKDGGIMEGITALIKERSIEGKKFTPAERLITEFRVVIHYITLLVLPLPSRLKLIYDFPLSHSLFDPVSTSICMGLIFGMICYAIYICKKRPVISFFILWFFINLAIESSVIRLWLVFEHRLYLPSIGFFVMATIGIDRLRAKSEEWRVRYRLTNLQTPQLLNSIICFLLIGIILTQSIWTIQRNSVWKDELTLWSDNLKKTPVSSFVYSNIGVSYSRRGEHEKAIDAFKKATEINPNNFTVFNDLCASYNRVEEFDQAITACNKSIELEPKYSLSYNNLGIIYNKTGKHENAINAFSKAIEVDPQYAESYGNLASVYLKQKKVDLAIKNYESVLKIDPDNKSAHNDLGVVYRDIGKYELAVSELERAVEINPEYSEAYNNLGIIYNDMGNKEKAVLYFKKAVEFDPQNIMAHNNLGLIYMDNGLRDEAIKEFTEVLNIDKDSYEASLNLGLLYQENGDANKAINYLMISYKIRPDDFDPNYYLGAAYHRMGNLNLAKRYYKNALEIKPETPFIYFNLALLYTEEEKWHLAEKSYQDALRLDPGLKSAEVNLKNILRQKVKKER